jgi:phosphoribosylformimino-5-aminoimidazole carboxamide ribotide isomerase
MSTAKRLIIPALDLIDGKVIRLHQGDYTQQRKYSDNPLDYLTAYQHQGAEYFHIVDLSGAKNPNLRQITLIKTLLESITIPTQVGGGIRTQDDIDLLLNAGANRVVIGSVAITSPDIVKHWFKQYGADKLVLALDIRIDNHNNKYIAIHGWQENSLKTLEQVIDDYLTVGLEHVLCTDIAKDGTLTGPNINLYQDISKQYPEIALQASGGISSLDDIKALTTSDVTGIIIGRALLEEKFTVKEAITCWQNV